VIIRFSRHARRRAKLYEIPENEIKAILEIQELSEGEHEIIEVISGFKYPIKIVFKVESNVMTIITNYPLKKGKKT
jgi:hypothetical protein